MTRDDIMRTAREAGISDTNFDFQMVSPEELERFAALVAAAERAGCAAVCKDEAKRLADSADRLESRGSNYEARQIRGLALKCLRLKDIIESRGKP